MINGDFSEHGQSNSVTLFEKHILKTGIYCEDLAWQSLKALVELANLTVGASFLFLLQS